jgi:hypothetical protein
VGAREGAAAEARAAGWEEKAARTEAEAATAAAPVPVTEAVRTERGAGWTALRGEGEGEEEGEAAEAAEASTAARRALAVPQADCRRPRRRARAGLAADWSLPAGAPTAWMRPILFRAFT